MGDYDAKYVLAFYQSGTKFGYCYFDMSTLNFYLGAFQDDFTLKHFRTLIMTIRPVEYICTTGAAEHTNIHAQETLKIIKNCPSPPVGTTISYKDASEADKMLKRYFLESKMPEALIKANKGEAKIALGLCLVFLDKLLLANTSLPVAKFTWSETTDSFSGKQATMLIDA
jgi:DNA mismatch repair ATPase MutS